MPPTLSLSLSLPLAAEAEAEAEADAEDLLSFSLVTPTSRVASGWGRAALGSSSSDARGEARSRGAGTLPAGHDNASASRHKSGPAMELDFGQEKE